MLTAKTHTDSHPATLALPRPHFLLGYLLCLPLLVVFYLVGSAGHDDSHITFWQAWTLNHQGALLNYNGERVEQSSSLLQVVITAVIARLTGLDEATSGYGVSLAAAFMAILLCYRIAIRYAMESPWLPALLTSSSIYFSYWACSGMETALAALCVLLCIDQCTRLLATPTPSRTQLLPALLCNACLAAVRPEMLLVGPVWLVCLSWFYPQSRRTLLLLLLPFALLALWRYQYFGQWFPNPVYAKTRGLGTAPLLEQFRSGAAYVSRLGKHPALLCLSLLFGSGVVLTIHDALASAQQHKHHPMLPWLLWTVLYAGFVVASGGDWMKEGRFWVPLVAPAALITGNALLSLAPIIRLPLIIGALSLQVFYTTVFLDKFNHGMRWEQQAQWQPVFAYASFFERSNREHLRDLPAIAELEQWIPRLHAQQQRPITLMSKQMGLVNYTLGTQFYGLFRVMDMAGLVENSLRNCEVLSHDGFDKQGMRLNYRKFFNRLQIAQSRCQINAPDVIYDIYGWGETTPLPDYLETQGYYIAFHQTGRVNMKPGADITAHEIIAIKRSLLGEDPDLHKTQPLDFDRLQPR